MFSKMLQSCKASDAATIPTTETQQNLSRALKEIDEQLALSKRKQMTAL